MNIPRSEGDGYGTDALDPGIRSAISQARVAPPMSSASIAPMQIMAASIYLPTEHFVDYLLVYP